MSNETLDKTVKTIFENIKISKHRYGVELSHFPFDLLDRIESIFSQVSDLNTYDDRTDDEGVFLSKKGYEKLNKVISHLDEIENILSEIK
ncbi:hypothetical protein KM915_21015 [Cytobacillus oceanisediminis]|uniref:hypothetical protein n=1 Tax=Cytobacillus oceanisediminis TaxID=665099 RepID=UPI001C244CB0|nr:hypothetical protein [Cytobacillus oceanisediminis]MBU8732533.1 hypothetical protein [Cytobacillus oceanisediminis]